MRKCCVVSMPLSGNSILIRREEGIMKKFQCPICGYIHEGEEPPASCPVCGAEAEEFEELSEKIEEGG